MIPGLLLAILALAGCQSQSATEPRGPSPKTVVIFIDSNMQAYPDVAHARRGDWILFAMTPGSGDLDIPDADFLEQYGHEREHAWGRVKADAALGAHKYNVRNLRAKTGSDPQVMIDP